VNLVRARLLNRTRTRTNTSRFPQGIQNFLAEFKQLGLTRFPAFFYQMFCLMKLNDLLAHLHRRIDDLERASRFAASMPHDPESPVLHGTTLPQDSQTAGL
jgi:hypothetical protein